MFKRALVGAAAACALALAGCGSTPVHQSATGSVHPAGWGSTPRGYVAPAPTLQLEAIPTQTMYDAVTVANIPARPFAVAGYTAGLFHTWPALLADFPAAHHISIAIQASFHADCLDVEPGDAVPSQAGAWAAADMRAGFPTPCEYSDLSEMPAVQASDRAALGPDWRAHVLLWLAWYRDIPGLVQGYDAVQYWDHCLGRSLDCSSVTLAFLKIAQPPYVPPAPPKPKPPSYDQEFNLCFDRGYIVRYDGDRHRPVPTWRTHIVNWPACNSGYDAGWKAAR